MSRRSLGSYSKSTLFGLKTTQKDLNLKDWSKLLFVQSIGVNPPNTINIGISKKNLNHLDKEGFEDGELEILECMQNCSMK